MSDDVVIVRQYPHLSTNGDHIEDESWRLSAISTTYDTEISQDGDLGLGNGRKPRSISESSTKPSILKKVVFHLPPSESLTKSDSFSSLSSENSDSETFSVIDNPDDPIADSARLEKFLNRKQAKQSSADDEDEVFPTYANISYGTSIRQQKKLFQQDLEKIVSKHLPKGEPCTEDDCKLCSPTKHSPDFSPFIPDEITKHFQEAQTELDELHLELENCQSRLEAKYQAIDILRKQAELCEREYQEEHTQARQYNRELEKPHQLEVNSLNFSLNHQASMMEHSQSTWGQRFDSLCRENANLTTKLQAVTDNLNKVTQANTGLKHERDELLALIDVQQRNKYEKLQSVGSEDLYSELNSPELAVLGACMCRGMQPDPCGCAHAALQLKKQAYQLIDQLNDEKKKRVKSEETVEAYRVAFEEQLERNKVLMLKIGELNGPTLRNANKTRGILDWILKNIQNQEMQLGVDQNLNGLLIGDLDTTKFSDRQLLLLILDMFSERTELRAHQMLAASIAKKLVSDENPTNETSC